MAGKGTTTIDFGTAPGTNYTSIVLTGLTNVLSTSHCEAFLMADTTSYHNAYEHMIVPITLRCGNIVEGTGFTIHASTELRLTGTFSVRWVWA